MERDKLVILGGGLAGLSTAYHLEKLNSHYQIFEKEDTVGGLCASKKVDGFTFDIDGHLLHFKCQSTLDLLKEVMDDGLIKHQRNSWVYSCGNYIRYPFQANLFGLPYAVVKECLLGFIQALNNGKRPTSSEISFQDWILRTFGQGIAEHFMLPYNRKFWTVPLEDLTCQWIDGFIPVPNLEGLIEGTITESKRRYGYNTSFWYPVKGGIQGVTLAFARKIKKVATSQEAKKIDLAKKSIVFQNGEKVGYDILISTIPLPEIAKLIEDLPEEVTRAFGELKWTSIFNLNLGIDRKDLSDRHWIYFPDGEFIFYRVGFPHTFSSSLTPPGKSSLYVEVSYSQDKPIEKRTIIDYIIKDLIKAGVLLKKDKIIAQDINDIKYGYIIYDFNHSNAVGCILNFLNKNNIFSIGRYGGWRYLSMEDTILEGKRISGTILV